MPPGNYGVSVTLRGRFLRTGSGSVTIDAGKTTTATVQVDCQHYGVGSPIGAIDDSPIGGSPIGAIGGGIQVSSVKALLRTPEPINAIQFFPGCAYIQ